MDGSTRVGGGWATNERGTVVVLAAGSTTLCRKTTLVEKDQHGTTIRLDKLFKGNALHKAIIFIQMPAFKSKFVP